MPREDGVATRSEVRRAWDQSRNGWKGQHDKFASIVGASQRSSRCTRLLSAGVSSMKPLYSAICTGIECMLRAGGRPPSRPFGLLAPCGFTRVRESRRWWRATTNTARSRRPSDTGPRMWLPIRRQMCGPAGSWLPMAANSAPCARAAQPDGKDQAMARRCSLGLPPAHTRPSRAGKTSRRVEKLPAGPLSTPDHWPDTLQEGRRITSHRIASSPSAPPHQHHL